MLSLRATHRHNAIGTVLVVVVVVIIVIGAGVTYVLLMRPSGPIQSSSTTSTASSTLSTTSSSTSSNSTRTSPTTSTSTASTTTATTTRPFPGVTNNVWTGTYSGTYTETGLPGTLTATDRGQIFFNTNTHKGTGFSTVTLMIDETGQPPCQLSGSVSYSFNISVTPRGANVSFVATSYSTNTIPSTGSCTTGAAQVALYGPMSNYANVELVTGAMWKFTYNSGQMEISASGTIYSCIGGLCPVFPDY